MLLISYTLRAAAYPLLSIFTGAYIWNAGHDVVLLLWYYVANFAALPPVFILNRTLLKHVRLHTLYGVGTMLTGVSSILVVFYRSSSPLSYVLYGLLYGLGNGIYWANRDFLSLRQTSSGTRSYFTAMQLSLYTVVSVIVPAAAGWLVITSNTGYQILVLTAFLLLAVAGFMVRKTVFAKPALTSPNPRPLSRLWRTKARFLSVAIGAADAPLYVLPTILILKALGNEGVLGSLNSALAVAAAASTYILGRKQKRSHFLPLFTGIVCMFLVSGLPLLLGITSYSVLWYILLTTVADNLIWTVNEPTLMDMMDAEAKRSGRTHYDLIIDREWFINVGRAGTLAVILPVALVSEQAALMWLSTVSATIALGAISLSVASHRRNVLRP